jgi:hypothetical protein
MAKRTRPAIDRMMDRVEVDRSGCWIFTGATGGTMGYGVLQRGRRGEGIIRAHRLAYEYFVGEIPADKVVDHICNTPKCVNPKHLRLLTHWENNARGNSSAAQNARKSCCPICGAAYATGKKNTRRCSRHPYGHPKFAM